MIDLNSECVGLLGYRGQRNSLIIDPRHSVAEAYNWLKSSARDAKMGTLSRRNHRTLFLMPGLYQYTGELTLDTDFVNILALSVNPAETILERTAAGITIRQTAKTVTLEGFTAYGYNGSTSNAFVIENEVRGTGATTTSMGTRVQKTGIGLGICPRGETGIPDKIFLWGGSVTHGWYTVKVVNNDNEITLMESLVSSSGDVNYSICPMQSRYRNMRFFSLYQIDGGVASNSDNWAPVLAKGHMGGVWENCVGGLNTFRVKNPDGIATLTIDNAAAVNVGGGLVGIPITGHDLAIGDVVQLDDTVNYVNKRYIIAGVAVNQINIEAPFVAETFDGDEVVTVYVADCMAVMRFCTGSDYSFFGDMCRAGGGVCFRCKGADYCFGGCGSWGCFITGDILFCEAGRYSFALGCGFMGRAIGSTGGENCFGGTAVAGNYGYIGAEAELKDCVALSGTCFGMTNNARGAIKGIVKRCRVGTVAQHAAGISLAYPPGGGFAGVCEANHGAPKPCTGDGTIAEFDNGQTYTNTGASGTITLSLPPAIAGLSYRATVQAAQEFRLDPNGTEQIYIDAAGQGAGNYIQSSTIGHIVELACFVAGRWDVVDRIGTWNAEP